MTTNLNKARTDYMTVTESVYGKLRSYSEALTEQFGQNWWMIPMKGPLSGNEAKVREAIRAEKAEVQKMAEAKKEKNPKYNVYKPWSDVLKYVKGDDKKGANANAPRDIFDRLKVELTKLYKAVKNHDDADTEALAQANWHIGTALTAIGVDLSELNSAD